MDQEVFRKKTVKNKLILNDLVFLNHPKFYRILENCIRFGQPLLIENIEEELDPILQPILLRQTIKKGN